MWEFGPTLKFVLGYIFCSFLIIYVESRGFRIALHCQAKFAEHGWVAGSEITTAGLKRAFEALSEVDHVEVFAPFSYATLIENGPWDFVLIEGYSGSVPEFIKVVRDAHTQKVYAHETENRNLEYGQPIIAHFCLDTYPSLKLISRLDVDMFFTNSHSMKTTLGEIAPTYFFELAADPDVMRPSTAEHPVYSKHNVVYLGHNSATKEHLHSMLLEAVPYGLTIYGHNWATDNHTKLVECWQGVLPKDDIGSLYSNAKVVIGVTEDKQKAQGMINNRVFEVLSAGAPLISDHFEALEEKFGTDVILFYKQKGDVKYWLEKVLHDESLRRRLKEKGRQHILDGETWTHRATKMLHVFRSKRTQTFFKYEHDNSFSNSVMWRSNRPKALFLYQIGSDDSGNGPNFLDEYILPQLLLAEKDYLIDLLPFEKIRNDDMIIETLDLYDIIMIYDSVDGSIDAFIRSLHLVYEVKPGENGYRDNTGVHGRKIFVVHPGSSDKLRADLPHLVRMKRDAITFYDGIILPPPYTSIIFEDNKNVRSYEDPTRIFTVLNTMPLSFPCSNTKQIEAAGDDAFLNTIFSDIYLRTRRSAKVYFQSPLDGDVIYLNNKMLHASVRVGIVLENFIPPRDGMWCLRVDQSEVLCIGDEKFNAVINVDMPASLNEKTVPLSLVLRNHIQRQVVYDGSDDTDQMQRSKIQVKIVRVEQSIFDSIQMHKKRKMLSLSTFVNTAPEINHQLRTVSFRLNMVPSDLSRVYCKYTLPWNPTRRKNSGFVVGTIEGPDIEGLLAKSSRSCERDCSVAVTSAVPVMDEEDQSRMIGNWHCPVPFFHYNIPMIAQFKVVLKGHEFQENFSGNKLFGLKGPSVLVSGGSETLMEETSKKMNKLLYFSNNCQIHERGIVVDPVTKTNSFTQLYRVACLNSSYLEGPPFHSPFPKNLVMWKYDFESLKSLGKDSFAAITIKIDLALEMANDLSNKSNDLDILVRNCKGLLQHNGTIRIVSYWSTLSDSSVTNSAKYHSKLIRILKKYDFVVMDQLGPMTTTSMIPNFEVYNALFQHGNGNVDEGSATMLQSVYVTEGRIHTGRVDLVQRAYKII